MKIFYYDPNRTPSGKKMVTGVQVVNASQVQSIGCKWKAIRTQTLTKRKAMGTNNIQHNIINTTLILQFIFLVGRGRAPTPPHLH